MKIIPHLMIRGQNLSRTPDKTMLTQTLKLKPYPDFQFTNCVAYYSPVLPRLRLVRASVWLNSTFGGLRNSPPESGGLRQSLTVSVRKSVSSGLRRTLVLKSLL